MMIQIDHSNHLDLHPRRPRSDPLPQAGHPAWDTAPGPPVCPCQGEKAFKSIYLFADNHDLPPNFIPALPRGDAPKPARGLQGEQKPLTPAPLPEQGKSDLTLQMLCKRAELFVLPEENKTKNLTTCFSQRQLNNFGRDTKTHTYSLERRHQHPAWKTSPQIINIWQREKQLKTGFTKECTIKITAGLPTCAVCYY